MLPQTINTAIVSPKARDMARTIAAIIPGNAFLTTTNFVVCHFVAPNESDASLSSFGIAAKTSRRILMIKGNVIMDKTIPPASTL